MVMGCSHFSVAVSDRDDTRQLLFLTPPQSTLQDFPLTITLEEHTLPVLIKCSRGEGAESRCVLLLCHSHSPENKVIHPKWIWFSLKSLKSLFKHSTVVVFFFFLQHASISYFSTLWPLASFFLSALPHSYPKPSCSWSFFYRLLLFLSLLSFLLSNLTPRHQKIKK